MSNLTRRELQCKQFIASYEAANGIVPSFREISEAIGIKSISNVHRILHGLEARGHLRFGVALRPRNYALLGEVQPLKIGPVCHHCGNPFNSEACKAAALTNTTRLVRAA